MGEWRGGIILYGGWQRTKTKGPCRSLIPQRFIFSQMYNFTSREESRIWGRGWGLKRQQGVWCCLKGISGLKDPIPPPSIPEEFLNTKDFVLRAAAGWDYQVEHLQCILIFKWIFMNPIFRWTMGFFIPPISPLSYHLSCKRSWPAQCFATGREMRMFIWQEHTKMKEGE